jgi:hypothetical protein
MIGRLTLSGARGLSILCGRGRRGVELDPDELVGELLQGGVVPDPPPLPTGGLIARDDTVWQL